MDALPKPSGIVSPEAYEGMAQDLLNRIKLYARVGKSRRWSAAPEERGREKIQIPLLSSRVVGIAASTGGPRTLAYLLGTLPADFPCPILLVQHMAEGFMRGFADWLGREISLDVVLVEHAMRLERGRVYLPPDGYHLEVARGGVTLNESPPVAGCRPSADILFRSMAEEFGARSVAVVLTGLGRDGAEGAKSIRSAGGDVVAQDEASSVVWGMPKAAIDEGASNHVASLATIPAVLGKIVGSGASEAAAVSAPAQARDILVVDDSATMRAMLADILIGQGYTVRQAENGRIALREVAAKQPDLLLLDVMMPEMDGYAVCRKVREERAYLPVLMITAKGEAQDLVQGIEAGADDYIAKPFQPMELAARVKSLLRIRELHGRLMKQNTELEAKNRELGLLARALDNANKELTLLSVTDGLTRAYNHRHFQERLKAEFARAQRYGTFLSCILADIDSFKQVNDTYGHPVGDQVLVQLVSMLQSSVRKEDLVARYGGEEFVLLLPETSGPRAYLLANRIRERVEQTPLRLDGEVVIPYTISLGVSAFEPSGKYQSADELISAADAALYRAKQNGKNRAELA
jgi:diguanylate cyclase (GGDEF)-like protein